MYIYINIIYKYIYIYKYYIYINIYIYIYIYDFFFWIHAMQQPGLFFNGFAETGGSRIGGDVHEGDL